MIKKILTLFIVLLALSFNTAEAAFNSQQLGTSSVPTGIANGMLLQTNGATSTWVTTASLGITPENWATSSTDYYSSLFRAWEVSGAYLRPTTTITTLHRTGLITQASSTASALFNVGNNIELRFLDAVGTAGSVIKSGTDDSFLIIPKASEAFKVLTASGNNAGFYDSSGNIAYLSLNGTTRVVTMQGTTLNQTAMATSTFTGGLTVGVLNVASTTASSTAANGFNLTAGCYAINGSCITSGAGGSSKWTDDGSYIRPTDGDGIIVNASSTISALTVTNGTTTNATSTNLSVSGNSSLGTVRSGTWNGSTIGSAYGGNLFDLDTNTPLGTPLNNVYRIRSSFNNFLSNSSFEYWLAGTSVAPSGWVLGGDATVSRNTTATIDTYSAQVVFGTANTGELYQTIGVSTLVDYTYSCYVQRTSGSGNARLVAQRQDTPFTEFASVPLSTSAGWQLITLTVIPSAGTQMRFAIKSTDTTASTWLVDECFMQESKGVASTYLPKYLDDTTNVNIYGLPSFFGGFLSTASSTIGNGNQNGGLTVYGGATTTATTTLAFNGGSVGIGTSTFPYNEQLMIQRGTTTVAFPTNGLPLVRAEQAVIYNADSTYIGVAGYTENTGATTPAAGHGVGVLGLARDTTSGKHSLIGVEGRVDARGNAGVPVGVQAVGYFNGTTFTGRTLYGISSDVKIMDNAFADLAEGTVASYFADPINGGASGSKYSFYGSNKAHIADSLVIQDSGITGDLFTIENDSTNANFISNYGGIIFRPNTGSHLLVGSEAASLSPLTDGAPLGVASTNRWSMFATAINAAGLITGTGGILAPASSTIGSGVQAGGLTVNGGATTSLIHYFASALKIGTTTQNYNGITFAGSAGSFGSVGATWDNANNGGCANNEFTIQRTRAAYFGVCGSSGVDEAYSNAAFLEAYSATSASIISSGVTRFYNGGTTAPFMRMTIIGTTGFVGIGTTTPYAKLSVVGEVVASHFTATSTTATSTFGGGVRMTKQMTPSSASATCTTGDTAWDATYFYICVSANSWERTQHDTW